MPLICLHTRPVSVLITETHALSAQSCCSLPLVSTLAYSPLPGSLPLPASWAGVSQVSPGLSPPGWHTFCFPGGSAETNVPLGAIIQLPWDHIDSVLLQEPDGGPGGGKLGLCCCCPCPPEFVQHHRVTWSRDSFLALPLPSSHLGQVKLTSLCLSVFICKMGIIAVLASKGFFG